MVERDLVRFTSSEWLVIGMDWLNSYLAGLGSLVDVPEW